MISTADIAAPGSNVVARMPAAGESRRPDSGEGTSHRQILKSSAIVGGSTVITIVFGIVRTKIMAVLLGPAGIGLSGVLDSVIQFARTVAGLGIDSSGVRQIAEAKGSEDQRKVSVTLLCVRRACVFLGIAGSLVLYLLRYRVSEWSFGNSTHGAAIGWLSLGVGFCVVSAGQSAALQGLRKIWEYVMIKVVGAVCALVFGIPIIFFWRQSGIVAYLLVTYISMLSISWWYARKIELLRRKISWREQAEQFRSLAKWGGVFLASASITTFVIYASRALISRHMGLEATGQYQAALALSSIYVGFILSAMGTDFYPMLTANANDNSVCNRLVNEQASISLLLGIPGILATLVFAELIVTILYSGKFFQAATILYWQMPGVLLRVAIWPLGIALAAKGRSKYFLVNDIVNGAVQIMLLEILTNSKYLTLVGLASTVAYFVSLPVVTAMLARSSDFRWASFNSRLIAFGLAAVLTGMAGGFLLRGLTRIAVGFVLVAGISSYCVHKIARLTGHSGAYSLARDVVNRLKRRRDGL